MLSVIGKKVGMTAIFTENGKKEACTVVSCEPNFITQIKFEDKDGYSSVQIASIEKKEKSSNKPEMGHFAKANTTPKRVVLEVRDFDGEALVGSSYGVEVFEEGEFVDVVGTTKGKGFQGVVNRHGFSGVGEATHGQHNRLRLGTVAARCDQVDAGHHAFSSAGLNQAGLRGFWESIQSISCC